MYKASSTSRQPRERHIEPVIPPPLFLFWPVRPDATQSNAKVIDGLGKVAAEWLDFVHRRLGEGVRLAKQLAIARSPTEAWSAYTDFLQQEVQDYLNEGVAMRRLTGEIMGLGADAAPGCAQEPAGSAPPLSQAA